MANLEWYRSFVAVYQVGTVSKAAESLHLTQPAVSQHVAALEATLGVELFQRMPRRMLPTEAGKRLYTRVVDAIETLASVPTKANLTEAPLLIRLGSPIEFFSEWILHKLPNDKTAHFSIQFGLFQDLVEKVLDNQIDIAIATQKITKPELEYQPIFEESFWLVGPPKVNIPLQTMNLAELEQYMHQQSWIAYSEDLPIIRRFWRVIFGRRMAVNPQMVLPDLCSIRSAVSLGFGYSVLPDYLCEPWINDGRLTLVLKPTIAVTNTIGLIYRKTERRSQQVMTLRSALNL